jgi:preprotein translocase subunit SecD
MWAPVIREPLFSPVAAIYGNSTDQQAHDMASRLSSGASKLEIECLGDVPSRAVPPQT